MKSAKSTKAAKKAPAKAGKGLQANEGHVEAFKALAHRTRLRIFFHLVKTKGEVSAGDIQKAMKVKGPTLSHHLYLLRRAGLINSRKEERYIYYKVQEGMAGELVNLLTACC
jgi:DNA-binding transcriptional ArsR family regulator